MYITHRYRRPPYGQKTAPETGYTCPICGYDVAWWDEPYEKDGHILYHLNCLYRGCDDYDRENFDINHERGGLAP